MINRIIAKLLNCYIAKKNKNNLTIQQFNNHKAKGFTLVELLVIIVMVGILSIAAVSSLNPLEQIKKGRDAQRKSDLGQIQKALETYNFDNGRYPDSLAWSSGWSPYMTKIPKDPKSPGQEYSYEVSANKNSYRLFAKLERCSDPHVVVSGDCNFAQFNYTVTSSNLAILPFSGPTNTPIPTSAPTPTPNITPTPTPTPIVKRVFLTGGGYNGNLGNLAGADAKCQARADAASLGGTWIAWVSSFISAGDRIVDAEYRRVFDNVIIANDKTDLLDGSLDNPINITEFNQTNQSRVVWTGTGSTGFRSSNRCTTEWTSTIVLDKGGIGTSGSTSGAWTFKRDQNCHILARLYCFEQ